MRISDWSSDVCSSDLKEGVVTRLGSYSRTVGPGVKFTWPAPIERIRLEDVRAIRTMAVGSPNATDENFVLTRDQSIVDLAYEVRWSVRDPELFFFQLADPEGTIREVAESAMRATVANFDLVQAIGPGRVEIEAQVQQRMQELLDQYRAGVRSEKHKSELQSLMRLSYAVFCLKKKKNNIYYA